ncbi:hypothetical protein CSAL01_11545 [Colletotrichum salicis]|uniref:Uncharacterized protein n=1 Tax=Colletotrichum salicis TaxID=1209931 RepID=A0A135V1N2_9PEZI|nr:hypothetical protein CSAL01_11545 [Colletotrichum salicis]
MAANRATPIPSQWKPLHHPTPRPSSKQAALVRRASPGPCRRAAGSERRPPGDTPGPTWLSLLTCAAQFHSFGCLLLSAATQFFAFISNLASDSGAGPVRLEPLAVKTQKSETIQLAPSTSLAGPCPGLVGQGLAIRIWLASGRHLKNRLLTPARQAMPVMIRPHFQPDPLTAALA